MLEAEGCGLKTDLYELTMAAGFFHHRPGLTATFELICHSMPKTRSYLVACGLKQAVDYVLNLRFTREDIAYLRSLPVFKDAGGEFFDYLGNFKFTGNIRAMAEGEIFFAREPLIQIEAPIMEAQILETCLLSIINLQSLVATKAARLAQAACSDGKKRGVIDFGARRAHGIEAGPPAARAAFIGGCAGTSNVQAGKEFGIPLYGTMAHSWVEAFDREEDSFTNYHKVFPDSAILLIDTYDTLGAAEKIAGLSIREQIKGVRLDSGDLGLLSKRVRKILDKAGLKNVEIIASGNLNEYKIAKLIKRKSPIDFFGVGTDLMTSPDCPSLDLTYKLVQTTEGGLTRPKAKRSPHKETLPGKKQVFRILGRKGKVRKDIIDLAGENPPAGAEELLKPVVERGSLVADLPSIYASREYFQSRLEQFSAFLDKKKFFAVDYGKGLLNLMKNKE
jgi:nicotinate phosphoribosyltransferase